MSTLDHNEPDDKKILGSHGPKEIDASAGYEQTDVRVTGIVVFLISLFDLRRRFAASSPTAWAS